MRFSVLIMCVGSVFVSYLTLYINTYYTGKLIQVGFLLQLKDLLPSFLYSFSMGALVYASTLLIPSMWIQLFVGVFIGIAYYLSISALFQSSELAYVKMLLRDNLLKRYGRE